MTAAKLLWKLPLFGPLLQLWPPYKHRLLFLCSSLCSALHMLIV
jgi:hypothetical protein